MSGDTTSGIEIGSTSTGAMVLKTNNQKAAECNAAGFFIPNLNIVSATLPTSSYSTNSSTYITVATLTLTTYGFPLRFEFDPSAVGSSINISKGDTSVFDEVNASVLFRILRDNTATGTTTTVSQFNYTPNIIGTSTSMTISSWAMKLLPNVLSHTVRVANITAGSYTYDLQIRLNAGVTTTVSFTKVLWSIYEWA